MLWNSKYDIIMWFICNNDVVFMVNEKKNYIKEEKILFYFIIKYELNFILECVVEN